VTPFSATFRPASVGASRLGHGQEGLDRNWERLHERTACVVCSAWAKLWLGWIQGCIELCYAAPIPRTPWVIPEGLAA
jgi:hypothetical protein